MPDSSCAGRSITLTIDPACYRTCFRFVAANNGLVRVGQAGAADSVCMSTHRTARTVSTRLTIQIQKLSQRTAVWRSQLSSLGHIFRMLGTALQANLMRYCCLLIGGGAGAGGRHHILLQAVDSGWNTLHCSIDRGAYGCSGTGG